MGKPGTPMNEWEAIPFDSPQGDLMLGEIIKHLPADSRLFKEISDLFELF